MIRDLIKYTLGPIASAGLSFVTTPLITFFISPEYFGIATIFSTVTTFLFPLCLMGSDQAFMRFYYEIKEDIRPELLWNTLIIPLCMWLIMCVVVFVLSDFIADVVLGISDWNIIFLLCLDILAKIINRFSLLTIRMQQKALRYSVLQFLTSLFNTVFILGYSLLVARSFWAIIGAGVLSTFVVSVIAIIIERKYWFSSIVFRRETLSSIIKYGTPLMFAVVFSLIFQTMDKYFLRFTSGFEQLGLYSAAFKIVAVLAIIQTGFSLYWTPVAFENYENNPNNTVLYEKVFKILLIGLIVAGLLVILFKDLIILILSASYREAAQIVPFLVFVPVLYTLTEVTSIGVYFKKRMILQTYVFGILVICSFGLNYLFVPMLGAKGTALALALIYLLYFYLRTYLTIKLYPINFCLWRATRYFGILWVVAFINTFVYNQLLAYFSGTIALLYILIVERTVFFSLYKQCIGFVITKISK